MRAATSTSPVTPTRSIFRRPPGASDIVFNGDLTIFWGDGFVTKLATDADTSAPPSTPPVPLAPTLLAPFNNDTPLQPITFDWSEVGGAASYTIQIDDSSAFNAPLVREQQVTGSMAVSSGLATVPHFWRVRAVNTAGVAGRLVRGAHLHAGAGASAAGPGDVRDQSVDGGRREQLERDRRAEHQRA